MRKYATEAPKRLVGADEPAKTRRDWWEIVRDQGPVPDSAFRVVTLPNGVPKGGKGF